MCLSYFLSTFCVVKSSYLRQIIFGSIHKNYILTSPQRQNINAWFISVNNHTKFTGIHVTIVYFIIVYEDEKERYCTNHNSLCNREQFKNVQTASGQLKSFSIRNPHICLNYGYRAISVKNQKLSEGNAFSIFFFLSHCSKVHVHLHFHFSNLYELTF